MQVQFLDFEDNQLEGSLPQSWATMQILNYIGLASNSFNGSLPSSWNKSHLVSQHDIIILTPRLAQHHGICASPLSCGQHSAICQNSS